MNKEAALVVFSGGQDSTTCLFWAKREFKKVYTLSFLYGQKHRKEVELAREIARKADVEFEAMDVSFIGRLGHNSLTDTTMTMDQEKPADSFPNTFVPGRNLFFLSIAAVYARERGINHIVTGVSQTDFSGYPDCRDAFIKSLNVTLNLAMDEQFVLRTPLMWIDKAEPGRWPTNWACSTLSATKPSRATTACRATVAGTVRPASCAAKDWNGTWPRSHCSFLPD